MSGGIRLRRLVLRGLNRDYGPSLLRDDRAAGLAVIAGEISTGKTTILEFIDYCLGASRHPEHPELLEASIRTALLELELNGETCVIERACFPAAAEVTIHWTDVAGLAADHAREPHPVRPASDPGSLSSYLLGALGLAGIRLKEAPTQQSSAADPLSFRDLLAIAFIDNDRLGSDSLLFENNRMKALKTTQVIDVIFGVHEDASADMSVAINEAETKQTAVRHEIATLTRFLTARSIPLTEQVTSRLDAIATGRAEAAGAIADIDAELRGRTEVANDLRERYDTAVDARRKADARLRDRETLLERLQVLNGQYAADIGRLEFSLEAGRLFDDLQVKVCPVCHSPLATAPTLTDGTCSLCGTSPVVRVSDVDVRRELAATKTRLDELRAYLSTVVEDVDASRAALEARVGDEAGARETLDIATASAVAPFVSQRDALLARQRELAEERASLESAKRLRAGLAERHAELARITREIEEMRERLASLDQHRQAGEDLLADLSARFGAILRSFRLAKVESPRLDKNYAPENRGMNYRRLSSGTKTLMSVAWALAILELAIERDQPHPGFLMIDGVSKNLTPAETDVDPDLRRDIIDRVYDHVLSWTAGAGRDAQLVFVDNRPPRSADDAVVVRYSSDPDRPPFGLIEDAIS